MTTNAGKRCLITGASSGIGYAMALELARRGMEIIMVSRDSSRGIAACDKIRRESGNDHVSFLQTDLSSQSSIRALCSTLDSRIGDLDILINNAGICNPGFVLSADGIEETFAVNYFAGFILTRLLWEKLAAAKSARVVNVSSSAHMFASIDWKSLNDKRNYDGWKAYCGSKLANLLFTIALARKLAGNKVTVNCFHPGTVATGVFKNIPPHLHFINQITLIKPEKAAATGVMLATAEELGNVSGEYFARMKIRKTFILRRELDSLDAFWNNSEALSRVSWKSILP